MTGLSVIEPRTYDFTDDFFSMNIPLFERFLGDLKVKLVGYLRFGALLIL